MFNVVRIRLRGGPTGGLSVRPEPHARCDGPPESVDDRASPVDVVGHARGRRMHPAVVRASSGLGSTAVGNTAVGANAVGTNALRRARTTLGYFCKHAAVVGGAMALSIVGASGGLGTGAAAADPVFPWDNTHLRRHPSVTPRTRRSFTRWGGARAPGIPWYDYTMRAGSEYCPNSKRELIDYPAGAPFSWMPSFFLPPGPRDEVTIGEAARQATNSLDTVVLAGGPEPAVAVGLSRGTLALDQVQVRLANDPKAPPPDQLTFTTIGDPTGTHAFGQSFLAAYSDRAGTSRSSTTRCPRRSTASTTPTTSSPPMTVSPTS